MYEFLLVANFAVWLGLTIYYLRLPCASIYHPVTYYLFFHFLVFVFRPVIAWYGQYELIYQAYEFLPSMDDKITVLLATMLGLVSFVGFALWSGDAPPRFPQDRADEVEKSELLRPFLIAAAIIVPFGLISILANWSTRANDTSTMVLDAATGYTVNTTSNGYVDNLQLFLAPMAVMCVWLYRFRLWTFIPLVGYVILRAGTGGRWPLVMACITVALLFLYRQHRKWLNLRAVAIGCIGLFVFQLVGDDRGTAVRRLFIEDNSLLDYRMNAIDLRFMEGMDFANLEFFEYLVYAVPQRTGTYNFFLDNLQILTAPIPRVFWEGKPIGAPIKLFSLFDYGYPIGMTYSLPGEGWVQLGYLGVAIWCGLFGYLFGWLYNRFQRSQHGNPAVLTYLLFLPLCLTFFRDGFLLTLIQTAAFFVFPVWLIVKIARLSAVPLADELRLRARRKLARSDPQVAPKILARQKGRPKSQSWPAE